MRIIKYIIGSGLLLLLCACQNNSDISQNDNIRVFAYNDYEYTDIADAGLWHKNTIPKADDTFTLNFKDSMLGEDSLAKVKEIVNYLTRNSGMKVKLLGLVNADGSDAYNNSILWAKLRDIASCLEQNGIDYERISIVILGASKLSSDHSKSAKDGLVEVFYGEI